MERSTIFSPRTRRIVFWVALSLAAAAVSWKAALLVVGVVTLD